VDEIIDLLRDNQSVAGRLVTSAGVILVAVVVAAAAGGLVARRADDPFGRYYARKVSRYVVAAITILALGVTWRAFAGRAGVVIGFLAAGVAFAMQEVIGAIAGWFNIVWGRIFRVGDRIQMGGVRGDVIDITPLRTKVMEIGSANDDGTWVRGRQFTGRVVAISNKTTFTEPVYNYSASFNYIWEEMMVPVAHGADWRTAAAILEEEAVRVSATSEARDAIQKMKRRYPVGQTEVEPKVLSRATDDYLELSARFVVPVREARIVKDELTRRVISRLEAAGIEVASSTSDVRVELDSDGAGGE
jgi:small-conductance mechanosensitive channel